MGAFHRPPLLIQLVSSPLVFFLRPLYRLLLRLRPLPRTRTRSQRPIRVVCVSDTHTRQIDDVPPGDLLVHAGDMTNAGTAKEIQASLDWLKQVAISGGFQHTVVIAGNHDSWLDEFVRPLVPTVAGKDSLDWGDIIYLQNETITLPFPALPPLFPMPRPLAVHGVPHIPEIEQSTPEKASIHAFQYSPKSDPNPYVSVPPQTDVLVTHSPARHHHDLFPNSIGDPNLLRALWAVTPALHVCGHVHTARGVETAYYDSAQCALERLCGRRVETNHPIWTRARHGALWWFFVRAAWLRELVNPCVWLDVVRLLLGLMRAIAWTRIWGGGREGVAREGYIVNAACLAERGKPIRGATVLDI